MTLAFPATTPGRLRETTAPPAVSRVELASACDERLFFAQVREDPRMELRALQIQPADRVVVVSSGGCTALSLLAAGAAEVHAVDMNRSQNSLVELKLAAVRSLTRGQAIGFMGGSAMSAANRLSLYQGLRNVLTPRARSYWDQRPRDVARGVIASGVSERFIRLVCTVVKHVVLSPTRVKRMLASQSVEAQRDLFNAEWNSRRWRLLFSLLLNRWSMSKAHDPRFFARAGLSNFADHFRRLAEHALTEVPIADNYFIHQMLTGSYAVQNPDGVPPFLGERGFSAIAGGRGQMSLVDGSMTDHLRTLPDASVNAIALSNICEWMGDADIAALFQEVERVAAPGARIVFRNFVGWTDLPPGSALIEDPSLGTELMRNDRSVVQHRAVVCRKAEL